MTRRAGFLDSISCNKEKAIFLHLPFPLFLQYDAHWARLKREPQHYLTGQRLHISTSRFLNKKID